MEVCLIVSNSRPFQIIGVYSFYVFEFLEGFIIYKFDAASLQLTILTYMSVLPFKFGYRYLI